MLGTCLHERSGWELLSRKRDGFDLQNIEAHANRFEGKIAVVNCIAHTKTYSNDDNHMKVNYEFVIKLVDLCLSKNIKLVHISTGYVYTNNRNNPTEEDTPIPQDTEYARTKLMTDEYVRRNMENYVIIRSVHKMKPFPYDNAFVDHTGNFCYVDEVADFIIECVERDFKGVYNVGKNTMSMYEFAKTTKPDVKPSIRPPEMPETVTFDCSKYTNKTNAIWKG